MFVYYMLCIIYNVLIYKTSYIIHYIYLHMNL